MLSDTEQRFIKDNYQSLTLRELAKKLKRGNKTILDWMNENGLEKHNAAIKQRSHPFRVANRQMFATAIARELENRKYNPR